METNEELMGSWVLVHPDLGFDAVERQGQMGIITYADVENDEFFVGFGKAMGLYAGDSLFTLRSSNDIYGSMMANVKNLEKDHIKDILRISMLVATNQPKDLKTAMEMAAKDEVVRSYSLISLEDKLGQQLAVSADQQMSAGRGR